jgi:quinate dehydrogenase
MGSVGAASSHNDGTHTDERRYTYLVGQGVSHSIAPPMHDYVAKSLGYRWQFKAQECPTVEDAMALFREPSFAGGVVTMPYKVSIMQHLNGLDEHAKMLKACNNVYRAPDGSLRGTNTDWRGIKGCLASASVSQTCQDGRGKPAMLVGAGGASRAALYVLFREVQAEPIYILNRDDKEVDALKADAEVYGNDLHVIHLKSLDQAKDATAQYGFPYYVVGTVPDFEPKAESEIAARDILEYALANAPEKGVVHDMCFKPRRTRTIKLAEKYDWKTVEGTGVIGHQISEQYRLWCTDGKDPSSSPITSEIQEGAWKVLREAADSSKAINF